MDQVARPPAVNVSDTHATGRDDAEPKPNSPLSQRSLTVRHVRATATTVSRRCSRNANGAGGDMALVLFDVLHLGGKSVMRGAVSESAEAAARRTRGTSVPMHRRV